eukprot:COSAG02_NODE_178_length_31091_cov_59.242482_6_plen_147_part_00
MDNSAAFQCCTPSGAPCGCMRKSFTECFADCLPVNPAGPVFGRMGAFFVGPDLGRTGACLGGIVFVYTQTYFYHQSASVNTTLSTSKDTYAAARSATYTFPSPLYVSLIAALDASRVCTSRDGTCGLNCCRRDGRTPPPNVVVVNP